MASFAHREISEGSQGGGPALGLGHGRNQPADVNQTDV